MPEIDPEALRATVVWSTFGLAFVLGAVMHRTNFCTMGAVADIVNISDWLRMRMWVCAMGVAAVGTQLLAAAGLLDTGRTLYAVPTFTWLSYLVGGLLFGFGMVLSSGCSSKTLVRLGSGSLKSLIVFVAIGLGAYMTLRGLTAVARVSWLDPVAIRLSTGQDLPHLAAAQGLGGIRTLQIAFGLAVGSLLIGWALASHEFRSRPLYLIGGVVPGLLVAALWWVSGHVGYLEEHPQTLEQTFIGTNSGRAESFSFVAPVAYTLELLMFWSDRSRVVTVGIAAVLGMTTGSAASALLRRNFRWEGFQGTEDTANHVVGGLLMGVGGVTAMGCTVGQGISGISTLAVGSFLATAAMIAGAVLALRYQMWRIEHSM